MSTFNHLTDIPVISTTIDDTILDYNFFASYIFDDIEIGKNISDLNTDNLNLIYVNLSNSKIYTILKEDISDNFFKNILDNSFDEIFVADKNGVAIYCNQSFEKHYGVKRDELIGKNINYVVDNNYVDILLFDKVIKEKKTITYKQKTITGRTILNTSSPILDKKGNIKYVLENCRDITENEILYNSLKHTKSQLEKEIFINSDKERKKVNFKDFKNQNIKEIIKKACRFSTNDVNILITGNSGTGKTALAKFIHERSSRSDKPFVSVNCATIPENLIESELFGYKKGAFTGALNSGKKGLVENAEGGTLFLDEISEIPINLQSKLLELIQEKQYFPIGDTEKRTANVRIITATNRDLEVQVREKVFRQDLFYRLNVVHIHMPPLSERKDDLEILTNRFLNFFNTKYNLDVLLPQNVYNYLEEYSFPGNIRELEYLIEYLVLNAQNGKIKLSDLPNNILNEDIKNEESINFIYDTTNSPSLKKLMDDAEKQIIESYYKKFKSSYKLANALNISQSTANRLINKHCK